MFKCMENLGNSSKHPENYKPKISLEEKKKEMAKNSKVNGNQTKCHGFKVAVAKNLAIYQQLIPT